MGSILETSDGVSASNLEQLTIDYNPLFMADEIVTYAFRMMRDLFIFTNKRLIFIDKDGNSTNYLSISYKRISKFRIQDLRPTESTVLLDIWLSGEVEPCIHQFIDKSANVFELQRELAFHVYG